MLFKDKLKEPVIYKGNNKAINELNQIQEVKKLKEEQNIDLESLSQEEQIKILKKQLEEKEVEVKYLKKLAALVQKRKAQQQKKK